MKQKFDIIQSTCLPIQIDNCNTDLIIPARYLASTTRDPKFFGDAFMHDLRYDAEGKPVPDFVMNRAESAEAPRQGIHAPVPVANMLPGPLLVMVCGWLSVVVLPTYTATTC